jgi:hypothetical protein
MEDSKGNSLEPYDIENTIFLNKKRKNMKDKSEEREVIVSDAYDLTDEQKRKCNYFILIKYLRRMKRKALI